jgi:hypothetical protein
MLIQIDLIYYCFNIFKKYIILIFLIKLYSYRSSKLYLDIPNR